MQPEEAMQKLTDAMEAYESNEAWIEAQGGETQTENV